MDFVNVAEFLQGIEKEVQDVEEDGQDPETLKNSLLGPKVSVNLLYLGPMLKKDFVAPDNNDVPTLSNTRQGHDEYQVRSVILSKLRVFYGVADPYNAYKLPAKK